MAMGSSPIDPREKRKRRLNRLEREALLVELVDTAVSSAVASRHAGSSPAERREEERIKHRKRKERRWFNCEQEEK
jgi:hypothetical protein